MSALLTVTVDRQLVGEARPGPGRSLVGRHPDSCVPLSCPWVSWVQLALQDTEYGWLVTNGYRTRMRATSTEIDAIVTPGGSVWIRHGTSMRLTWPELPRELIITLLTPRPKLPMQQVEKLPRGTVTTRMPTLMPALSDQQVRHRMAVLFRHLLLDEDRPENLYRSAAERLAFDDPDKGTNLLKQAANRLIHQLNRERSVGLEGVDSLGHYLVFTSGALSPDDLE